MATFEELFPDQPQAPFEPIIPGRIRRRVAALDVSSPTDSGGGFEDAFGDLLNRAPAQPEAGSVGIGDFGRRAVAGVGELGEAVAGAGEYLAGRVAGEGSTPLEQGAADLEGYFRRGRQTSATFARNWYESMSPEARLRAEREILTLDPNKTIWQGGPREFLSSIGLKMAGAAPSTLVTLVPGAIAMRAGLGSGAITYLGASEGGLSLGSIAANIATEIEQAPEAELLESERYRQLRQTMAEPEARQALAREAQGYAPVIGGLVVGAISAAAGRYLEPVLTDAPARLAGRFGRGFASEAAQEAGQSGAEQIAQNIAAQVYDADRGVFQAVPEQTAQGAAIGGALGGTATAALGPRPRAALPLPGGDTPTQPSGTPPQAAPESFESVFRDQLAPPGGWRGGDIETGSLPDIDSAGQRLLSVGPVDPDVQAALNARRDKLIPDMFEEQPPPGVAGPGGADMREVWARNQAMDLPQGPRPPGTDLVPVGQLTLPLRTRVRGAAPDPVYPIASQPFNPDMSAPPSVAMDRLPVGDIVAGRRPTRADFLRARAEQERAQLYAGTMRDENQLDMFEPPREPRGTTVTREIPGAPGPRTQEGVIVRATAPDGSVVREDIFATEEEANTAADQWYKELPDALINVERSYTRAPGQPRTESVFMPDQPSAEPLGDLLAQLEELSDPDSSRTGVYLSAATIDRLRANGTFERVRGAGVPLPNFDGEGGTLIAKNRAAADEFLALRDQGTNLQEILGLATGAGTGKPPGADIVVQQRDEQGNVVRESLVSTPEEADALAQAFDVPGREGVILSAPMAIRRREQLLRKESREAQAAAENKRTRRKAEDIIERELGDSDLATRAKRRVRRAISENEAARRLVEYASTLRKRELARRLDDVDSPESLEFSDLKVAQEYKDLFGQYRDAEIAEHMAETAEDALRARAKREGLRRQIGAFRRLHKATTPSERVVRVAREISQEEVQKIEREAQEKARGGARSQGDILGGPTRDVLERATEEQIKEMSDAEVNLLFVEAANVMAGTRVRRQALVEGTRRTAEAGASTEFVPYGKTLDEIIAAYPSRSEKIKLIERAKRMLASRASGGRSKTAPITAKAGERKTATGEKVAVRRGEFRPTQAFELAPPRELSKEAAAEHNARVRKTYHELDQSIEKLSTAIQTVMKPMFMTMARQREANGTPPQNARDIVYGRAYLRTLFRYGNLLRQLHPRSVAGLKEVERFNKTIGELAGLTKENFVKKLAQLMEAEITQQAHAAARVDPVNLGFLRHRKRRQAAALESVANLREKIARSKRLHDKWHTNVYFNNYVAPLMQKLIGYTTRDSAFWNYSVERRGLGKAPTLQEMEGLRFALRRFRGSATAREDLFKPLKRWFEEFGFKFDGQDLVIPRNAEGKFEYTNEAELLRKFRNRVGYEYVPTYRERVKAYALRRQRAKQEAEAAREARRRAMLTPRQRAAEDRRAAMKQERARRKGMSPEQRKALESLDRRDKLFLDLAGVTRDMPELRSAAAAAADMLETKEWTSLDDVLKAFAAKLPQHHPYHSVIQRLILAEMPDVIVGWGSLEKRAGQIQFIRMPDGRKFRRITINRDMLSRIRSEGRDPTGAFVHTLIHEAVHAATVGALRNNPNLQRAMWTIMRQAVREGRKQGIIDIFDPFQQSGLMYGFQDTLEFVAEAFSNTRFQDALRKIKVDNSRTLWQQFLDIIARLLGFEQSPRVENMLDLVLTTSDQLFTGEFPMPTSGQEKVEEFALVDSAIRHHVSNVIDKVIQTNRVAKSTRDRAVNIIEANKEGGSRFVLSALTMEQIRDFYSDHFGGSGGPLSEYMKAFFLRNADNSANMEAADKLSRRWTALTEKANGQEPALEMSRLMTEATLYGIHPNEPLQSKANEHVKSVPQKQRHAELARRYRALPAEWQQLYHDVQEFYDRSLRQEVNLMALNALRAVLTKGPEPAIDERHFKYTEHDIEEKKLNTKEGLEKEFGDKLTPEERTTILRIATIPQNRIGPYFPLMRFGDYVVTAERVRERRSFSDRGEAARWAAEQRADDPTLSVSSPQESEEGQFIVTVTEKEVRMAETPSEAEQARQDMIEEYGSEHVSQAQLKAKLFTRDTAISSNSALGTILDKLRDNPAAQAAIKDFYLRSLADGAFRKREIKRANRRGVDYETQHRTFASYAKSAAYYTSQLRFGWRLADALIQMQKYVEETARGEHEATISPIRMGEVVREIDTRNKLMTDHVEVSKLVRGGTELSQFMMLTSPSYWMINATQPYMVTLPWLAARSSLGEASAALVNAQSMILSPIVNQMGESFGGLKALASKAAAERAFTVLEQVEQHIRARGGDRANEYIDMLQELKRHSIIDLSFVAELRDIAEGQNTSLISRVLDASRIMAHLTEVNNRILTALAAYDLFRNRGHSKLEASEFAKQAVSLTQFNYSSLNAPRLFQARGPLGQLGPLIFQFMKYPQHMYALMISNMRQVVRGGAQRRVAAKTLAGLFLTHLAAGGVLGAMIQPVKWAIGLTMAVFGDDDEPYTIKNALSGDTFDRLVREAAAELFGTDLGEVVAAGLPRAAGFDLSSRMSLGTLYFIDLKTDTAESTLGSIASTFGGPLLSLATSFIRGAQYMREGQFIKGLENFLPKGGKDVLRMIRYSNTGLTDATGKEIIGAQDMSPWELFLQSVGFQPARVSEAYARRAAIKDAQGYDAQRRATLLRRYQNASSAEERAAIRQEIYEFSKANPAAAITRSQLLKSVTSFREREQRVKTFGVDLRGDDIAYVEEGEPYE